MGEPPSALVVEMRTLHDRPERHVDQMYGMAGVGADSRDQRAWPTRQRTGVGDGRQRIVALLSSPTGQEPARVEQVLHPAPWPGVGRSRRSSAEARTTVSAAATGLTCSIGIGETDTA